MDEWLPSTGCICTLNEELEFGEFDLTPLQYLLDAIKSARHSQDKMQILDNDAFVATIVLSLLSDPRHSIGKMIGRQVFMRWIARGGKIPAEYRNPYKKNRYELIREEIHEFKFCLKYLNDCGVKKVDLARAFAMEPAAIQHYFKKEIE